MWTCRLSETTVTFQTPCGLYKYEITTDDCSEVQYCITELISYRRSKILYSNSIFSCSIFSKIAQEYPRNGNSGKLRQVTDFHPLDLVMLINNKA